MTTTELTPQPEIISLQARPSGWEAALHCGLCSEAFVAQVVNLCGVPFSRNHCPNCQHDQNLSPEHFELALHHFASSAPSQWVGRDALCYPSPAPSKIGPLLRSASPKPRILFAPAMPQASVELAPFLARRFISLSRRISMLAHDLGDQVRITVRPDDLEGQSQLLNSETWRLFEQNFLAWLGQESLEVLEFSRAPIDAALANCDLLVTHVGAPWINAALDAGKEVFVASILPNEVGDDSTGSALVLRDSEITASVERWLNERPKTLVSLPCPPTSLPRVDERPLRVLMAYRDDVDVDGGAAAVMKETARAMRARGHMVDLSFEITPDTNGYDVVHAFNVWHPKSASAQLLHFSAAGLPIVWSPIYLDLSEFCWAGSVLSAIFNQPVNARESLLAQFDAGNLVSGNYVKGAENEILEGYFDVVAQALALVDHVCVTSHHEVRRLMQHAGSSGFPFTVTPHGVAAEAFQSATSKLFVETHRMTGFILCVGAIDPRKNQLQILRALAGTDRKLVCIGPAFDASYLYACQEAGAENFVHLGYLDREMVASALQACAVHVLPSYAEGAALANLEAAVAKTAMVVSNRSSEFEYFGDGVYFCDPLKHESIGDAIDRALAESEARVVVRDILAQRVSNAFTWAKTAELTELVYRSLLVAKA